MCVWLCACIFSVDKVATWATCCDASHDTAVTRKPVLIFTTPLRNSLRTCTTKRRRRTTITVFPWSGLSYQVPRGLSQEVVAEVCQKAGVVNLLHLFIAPNFVHTPRRNGHRISTPDWPKLSDTFVWGPNGPVTAQTCPKKGHKKHRIPSPRRRRMFTHHT